MSLRLHREHGVNPSVNTCFFCGESKEVILFGDSYKGEAPHKVCMDREPCDECKDLMSQGVMLISTRDGEEGDNPYRTGRICVVTDEAIRKIVNSPEHAADIIRVRFAFVEDATWTQMGLPTTDIDNRPKG